MLEFRGITMKYGKNTVLRDVSIQIADGCAAIQGRNGAGKSTLLSIASGLLSASGGEVLWNGEPVRKHSREIGFVAQNDNLFETLSVADNLKFWALSAKLPKSAIKENALLETLGIYDFMKKRVRTLSGGMKRRVSIAAALISLPDLIILDEPFTGLDAVYKSEIKEYLMSLKEMGKTIIYSCHEADEADALADARYLVENGAVARSG